jgi:hypothetical protein
MMDDGRRAKKQWGPTFALIIKIYLSENQHGVLFSDEYSQ